MTLEPLGDTALTLRLFAADVPGPAALAAALRAGRPFGVVDVIPAFDAVTIVYDPAAWPADRSPVDDLARWARHAAAGVAAGPVEAARTVELPVRYGGTAGPDLATLAPTLGLSETRLIALHAGGAYTVAAVGFLPGFAYLTGLAKKLRVPRRATPRVRVPAGSVAIGGPYTGVYPIASPGGWHLIGRTPTVLFDPADPAATPLRVGDRVTFVPIPG